MKHLKFSFFVAFLLLTLINCRTSRLYSKKYYDDEVISVSEKIHGVYFRNFKRHNLLYIDKTDGKQIIERKVFRDSNLLYRYPIVKSNIPMTDIKLLSGNNYLKKDFNDTIQIINSGLPIMNRTVYVKGALISRTSDSTYLIKAKDSISLQAKFYITASDNFEEIKNRKSFISDSLIVEIR